MPCAEHNKNRLTRYMNADFKIETSLVLEQTKLGGITYILVTDTQEGDGEALILKDLSTEEDAEALYEIVSEDDELQAVAAVFENLLDDIELN